MVTTQEPPRPLVYIVDIETTSDITQALVYDDVDDALEICEIICGICGGAVWEELPNGKYVVKAPDGTYLCAMIPGDPDADDEDEGFDDGEEDEDMVHIVDVLTVPDIERANVIERMDTLAAVCEIVTRICGGARQEEISQGKFVVRTPDGAYVHALVPDEPCCHEDHGTESEPGTVEVLRMLTNPIYIGLGPTPALVSVDLFASAGARFIPEVGEREYLGVLYDNLRAHEEFSGHIKGLGTREDFIDKQAKRLRDAPTIEAGLTILLEGLKASLAPS